jgi:hypothetical protein
LFTYPIVGELPKSSVTVDIIKSLDTSIDLASPTIEYVVSNGPTNDAPEDIVYEFVASLIICNAHFPTLFSWLWVIFCANADVMYSDVSGTDYDDYSSI